MVVRVLIAMVAVTGCVAFYKYILHPLMLLLPVGAEGITFFVDVMFVVATIFCGILIIWKEKPNQG